MRFIHFLILSIGLCFVSISASAQRFAYIDTEYILQNIPEYQEAQSELDALAKRWQNTVEAKYAEIEELRKLFKAEKILMTADMIKQKEEEIKKKEKDALQYQKDKFGVNGELFTKRKELVQPLQDKIFNAVKDLAERGSYVVIFDKAQGSGILYSSPKFDKSDEVLKKLGYKGGTE